MKVERIVHVEDCFDGSFIRELRFDRETDEAFVRWLGTLGVLRYFPSFARPFYKVRAGGRFELKGVEGNRTARALLLAADALDELTEAIRAYDG